VAIFAPLLGKVERKKKNWIVIYGGSLEPAKRDFSIIIETASG